MAAKSPQTTTSQKLNAQNNGTNDKQAIRYDITRRLQTDFKYKVGINYNRIIPPNYAVIQDFVNVKK